MMERGKQQREEIVKQRKIEAQMKLEQQMKKQEVCKCIIIVYKRYMNIASV